MFPIKEKMLTKNKYSRPGTKLKPVKGIVIHWTANEGRGANALANINYFENRKLGKTGYGSAHYFIDSTSIVRCLPENEMAYHVGATSYKTKQFGSYPNDCTIGIEMCINSDGNFKTVYEQTVELTAMLVKKYKLNPDKDVVRHYDVTGKNCPGYFTSDHWGKTNNSYAVKYGLGSSADAAWLVFKARVKEAVNPGSSYPYNKSKGIGMGLVTRNVELRDKPSFDKNTILRVINKGEIYYVYGEEKGMYNLGGTYANKTCIDFKPHPK